MRLEALGLSLSLLLISAYYAWRYSKTSVDPDWAYFNLYAFTGSLYGRDFADCKTPGVHIWYWLLSRLVGRDVKRVKFANHFLLGAVGVILFVMTGNYWSSLAYTVLINSGWLLAFHGNVGQVPAALVSLAMVAHPAVSFVLWILAVLYEPKLLLSFSVVAVLKGWWIALPFASAGYLLAIIFWEKQWFRWLWESSVTIPSRIGKSRHNEMWFPWFTSNPVLYLLPWIFLGVKAGWFYWLPAIVYVVVICLGRAIRSNHFIPLIPWIALSGISPMFVLGLAIIDFISSGLYLGDIWLRYYPALGDMNEDARAIGEWLKDKAGSLYVNGIHSGIYIHARKPLSLGMTEQIEIREVAKERRAEMVRRWKETPPDWVVIGDVPGVTFKPVGYSKVATVNTSAIYRKGV